ncbi:molybdopterin converting factor subunit 1 [Planctomicrobium sp. SH661]|uniref:molybdopterin converting factor subunit 1 n=1 Tax=Planctomicrobium sp. SH661 TaxID=3448124 RepID=UPI003F5AF282
MQVQVKLFARVKDLVGEPVVELSIPDNGCVRELRAKLAEDFPAIKPLLSQLFIAVNEDYATDESLIPPGATVACFPPVSGG